MRCVYCGGDKTKVVNTTKTETKVLRERKCLSCRRDFWTKETSTPEEQSDLRRELYLVREIKKERNSARGFVVGCNAR